MRTITTLGEADARAAIEAIRAELARRGKTAVIAVADAHGEAIALLRLDGAALSSVAVALNKAYTAARLRRPTRMVGRNAKHPETGFQMYYYGDQRYVGWGGGLPVMAGDAAGGVVVGAIGVSGLSEDEDEALAAIGIAAISGATRP